MFVKNIVLHAETQPNLRRRMTNQAILWPLVFAVLSWMVFCSVKSMSKTIQFTTAQCNSVWTKRKLSDWVRLTVSRFWRSYNSLICSPCVSKEWVPHYFIFLSHTDKKQQSLFYRSQISVLTHRRVNQNPKCPALHFKDLSILSVMIPQSILLYLNLDCRIPIL